MKKNKFYVGQEIWASIWDDRVQNMEKFKVIRVNEKGVALLESAMGFRILSSEKRTYFIPDNNKTKESESYLGVCLFLVFIIFAMLISEILL